MNKKMRQTKRTALTTAQKDFTRRKAERLCAETTDPEVLSSDRLLKHRNKHVRAKAEHKLARTQQAA